MNKQKTKMSIYKTPDLAIKAGMTKLNKLLLEYQDQEIDGKEKFFLLQVIEEKEGWTVSPCFNDLGLGSPFHTWEEAQKTIVFVAEEQSAERALAMRPLVTQEEWDADIFSKQFSSQPVKHDPPCISFILPVPLALLMYSKQQ